MSGTGDKGHDPRISEADVERIYQGLPKAHPGARLDTRILQASRAVHGPGRSYPWRWQRPLAMAATVILCVGLVSFYYLEPGMMPTGSLAPPEQAAKARPGSQSLPKRLPSRPAAPMPAEQDISAELKARVAGPVTRGKSERKARAQELREPRRDLLLKKKTGTLEVGRGSADSISTMRPHGSDADTKAQLRQAPAEEEAAGKASAQGLSSDALKPATISPRHSETAPIETAVAMLLRIRKLHDSGQGQAADRLWREFQQRYPAYPRARITAILGQGWETTHWGTTR